MKVKEIISEGVGSLIGRGLLKLGTKLGGKAAAKAALRAAPEVAKDAATKPGLVKQALKYGTIGSGVAGGYHYLTDPDKPSAGVAFGRGMSDVHGLVKSGLGYGAEFAKDVVKGYGDDKSDVATTEPNSSPGQSARPQTKSQQSDDPEEVAPEPDKENYIDQIRRNQDERYGQWGKEANESVKKKIKLDEVDATQQAFMDAIKSAESGGRNIKNVAGSSAYGHYQFLKSTAERMARDPKNQNTSIYGKSWEEYKRDPGLQREFMKVATKDYTDIYQQNKIPVTGGTLYMAHHFGPTMAVKMYNAGPKAQMSDFYPEYVTKKNPKTGQPEKVRNLVYIQNPSLKPNQSVQYTHDRLDSMIAKRDRSKTLASLDKKNLWTGAGISVATAGTGIQGAKPTDLKPQDEPKTLGQKLDKIVQPEPRLYKRGELSIDQYMKKSQDELDRLRAAAQRVPGSQITKTEQPPSAGTVITKQPQDIKTADSSPKSIGLVDKDSTEKVGTDTTTDVQTDKNIKQQTAVAESVLHRNKKTVNKKTDLEIILKLAGR